MKGLAWIYLAGAVVLWLVLAAPGGMEVSWLLGFSLMGLILLMLPSGILFLFFAGLNSVSKLPARLMEKAEVGETQARSMLETARASELSTSSERGGKLLRSLFDLRKLVLESKGMLLEYAALLRLANPFILAIVGLATVFGFFVVVGALIGVLVLIF